MTPAQTIHIEQEAATSFWAVSGDAQAIGETPGQALDNLMRQLPSGLTGHLIVLPRNQPDAFFTRAQQERLLTLMEKKTQHRLSTEETTELAELIDEELLATGKRAAAWYSALHP